MFLGLSAVALVVPLHIQDVADLGGHVFRGWAGVVAAHRLPRHPETLDTVGQHPSPNLLTRACVEQVFTLDAESRECGQVDGVDLHDAKRTVPIREFWPDRARPA